MSIISYPQPGDTPGTPPLPPPDWAVIDAWEAAHGIPPWPRPVPPPGGDR